MLHLMRFFIFFFSVTVLFTNSLWSRTIAGHITTLGGGPLAGVKVSALEASSIFTLSDSKGFYTLDVPEEVSNLVFSHSDYFTKTVSLGNVNTINVVLRPSKYKKFRFGIGFTYGASNIDIYNEDLTNLPDTSVSFGLKSFSIDAHLHFRLNNSFDVQAIVCDDLNFMTFTDSLGIEQTGNLNRLGAALLINWYYNFPASGNYSIYAGAGPQYQHFAFLESNTVGLRLQAGVSLNNYGFNPKLFFVGDISSGTANSADINGFRYSYSSFRIGIEFTF